MSYMSSWATHDKRGLLHLADPVIAVFRHFAQTRSSDLESGGLLLGTVHGASLAVVEATVPSETDTRSRTLFERMPFLHSAIAQKRWCASGGLIRYLGEWHTHPEDYPQPSALDRVEWRKLALARKDGRPMLAVIVGRKALHVELVSAVGTGQLLNPMK